MRSLSAAGFGLCLAVFFFAALIPGCWPQPDSPRVVGCRARYAACVDEYPPGPEHRSEYDRCAAAVDVECMRGAGGAGGGR